MIRVLFVIRDLAVENSTLFLRLVEYQLKLGRPHSQT